MNQVKSMWCHTLFLAQRYLVPICSMAQWMWSLHDPPYFSEGFISRQQETRSGFWQVPQWQVHPHPLMKQHLDTKTSLLCDVPFQKRGIRFYSPPTLKRGLFFVSFFFALWPEMQIMRAWRCLCCARGAMVQGTQAMKRKRWSDCNSGKQQELLCPKQRIGNLPISD